MERFEYKVDEADESCRLDRWLAERLPELSRSKIQSLIHGGFVTVNNVHVKPGFQLKSRNVVRVQFPDEVPDTQSEHIVINSLYEDEDIIAINKQGGLVVHPGIDNQTGTLVQALLVQGYELAGGDPERPGVVHRLDKETSGVIVMAKSDEAYDSLVRQFSERTVDKFYLALVDGILESTLGRIEAPIGRNVRHPSKMSVSKQAGKEASTEFKVLDQRDGLSLLLLRLITGRTHQIRVHLDAIGHAIVGDGIYGSHAHKRDEFGRMMLHAWRIRLDHPITGERLQLTATPPTAFEPYCSGLSLEDALAEFESS